MLEIRDFHEVLLVHPLIAAGPIPTVFDPEGVYPYPSFVETAHRPIAKTFRFVALENENLRALICPDLGGKVYSLINKKSNRESLFIPESVRPVRILPRLAFSAGGIEVSFPISHSPVQLEPLHYRCAQIDDRAYVWCGEREVHEGMQWTVEFSLGSDDVFLTQRTGLRNETREPHLYMSWSNAAVPTTSDLEFHFPDGPVLAHGAEIVTLDWASQGPRRLADVSRMTGYFWRNPGRGVCGVFSSSSASGLYHVADPATVPGMKLWTYGVGRDEAWGRAVSGSGQSYVEVQGGPIRDQSIRGTLAPGETRCHTEFWFPAAEPLALESLARPEVRLLDFESFPWFDWAPRRSNTFWNSVLGVGTETDASNLPVPPRLDEDLWPPRAMEGLDSALNRLIALSSNEIRAAWQFELASWLAAGGQVDAALAVLRESLDDRARALAARLYLRAKKDAVSAAAELRQISSRALALHPQIVVERDLALSMIGANGLEERESWLALCTNAADEWLQERRAALLLDQGKPEAARDVLLRSQFQQVHQRYARTELWQRLAQQLQLDLVPPASLGEDDLARFGAYRQFE